MKIYRMFMFLYKKPIAVILFLYVCVSASPFLLLYLMASISMFSALVGILIILFQVGILQFETRVERKEALSWGEFSILITPVVLLHTTFLIRHEDWLIVTALVIAICGITIFASFLLLVYWHRKNGYDEADVLRKWNVRE